LIALDAVFWFSDGSHRGLPAIRAAFEATWAALGNDSYWLDDIEWLAEADTAAVCLYRFNWRGTADGRAISGHGRGTTAFALIDGQWRIVHEHLSADAGCA
jgi:ketosteroid isomerase-like protein